MSKTLAPGFCKKIYFDLIDLIYFDLPAVVCYWPGVVILKREDS